MTPRALLSERLRSHRLTAPAPTVTSAATHMLAVQSQDFLAGRWALGVRSSRTTLSGVDRAFARGTLVRTWTMRGTLHIIPAADVRWVLSVTAERQLRQAAGRHRALGIDDEVLSRVARAVEPRLVDGGRTRAQLFDDIAGLGVDPGAQRGAHILLALCVRGVLVQGPVVPSRNGAVAREQLFVSADAHLPSVPMPDDALAELFVRYVDGHGPVGAADFAWWSGLPLGSAREAVERARHRVVEVADGIFVAASRPRRARGASDDAVIALPMFDEYYISYADRAPVADDAAMAAIGPGANGMVRATLLHGGRVVGAWSHASAYRDAPPDVFTSHLDPDATATAMGRFTAFVEG